MYSTAELRANLRSDGRGSDGARLQAWEAPHSNLLLLGLHESVESFC